MRKSEPFKRSDNNDERTPEGEPLEHVGSGSVLGSKKLVLVERLRHLQLLF